MRVHSYSYGIKMHALIHTSAFSIIFHPLSKCFSVICAYVLLFVCWQLPAAVVYVESTCTDDNDDDVPTL